MEMMQDPGLINTNTLTKTLKSEDHYQVVSFKALTNFKEIIKLALSCNISDSGQR